MLSQVKGEPVIKYMDSVSQNGMWRLVCKFMNKTLAKRTITTIKNILKMFDFKNKMYKYMLIVQK